MFHDSKKERTSERREGDVHYVIGERGGAIHTDAGAPNVPDGLISR